MLYEVGLEFDPTKTWLPYTQTVVVSLDPSKSSLATELWKWILKEHGENVTAVMYCKEAQEGAKPGIIQTSL